MELPLDDKLRFGWITGASSVASARAVAELAESLGYDSLWTGDHVAFPVPILDPLLQLAQLAAFSEKLMLGTSVYLLPLRHPTPVAKQVATLDHLSGGRFIFGVGVGGEFPDEYAACGVPLRERGARLDEAIPLLRQLWSGDPVHHEGRFWKLPPVRMLPRAVQEGGPPIWCGGRADAVLERIGRMGDGWISYVVTPDRYRKGLVAIASAAAGAGRKPKRFGSAHLLFTYVASTYEAALDRATEHLSTRYAMDFRGPARKYAALGRPEDVAARIAEFREAGVRHVVVDLVGRPEERDEQVTRFAREVRPLLEAGEVR